jgi:hypothetical protein
MLRAGLNEEDSAELVDLPTNLGASTHPVETRITYLGSPAVTRWAFVVFGD